MAKSIFCHAKSIFCHDSGKNRGKNQAKTATYKIVQKDPNCGN